MPLFPSIPTGGLYSPGMIMKFTSPTAPLGFLVCDGSAVSRVTYAGLYGVIGNTYGIGDGSTTFNVPDFRGMFVRGYGSATNDLDAATRTAPVSGTFTVGGGVTNATSNITVTATSELVPGMTVTGTDIPASSVVQSITSPTVFVLGNLANSATVNATSSHSSITFTFSKSPTGNYLGSTQANNIKAHTHSALGGAGGSTLPWTNAASTAFCALSSTSVVQQATFPSGLAPLSTTGGNETRPNNTYVLYCIMTGV